MEKPQRTAKKNARECYPRERKAEKDPPAGGGKKNSTNNPNKINFHKKSENHRRTHSDPIPRNQEELKKS
jgi:hypothetical protein